MKKVLLYILISVSLSFHIFISCDLSYKDENDFWEWADEKAPISKKEQNFIDSVANTGFIMSIKRPFIGRQGYGEAKYSINLSSDTFYVNQDNYRYLIYLRNEIIHKMCNEVIQDSVLYDTKTISFVYILPDNKNGKYYNSGVNSDDFFPIETYPLDSILNECGFKVVKKGKVFGRIEK